MGIALTTAIKSSLTSQMRPASRSSCMRACSLLSSRICLRQNLFSLCRAELASLVLLASRVRLCIVLNTVSSLWISSELYLRSSAIYSRKASLHTGCLGCWLLSGSYSLAWLSLLLPRLRFYLLLREISRPKLRVRSALSACSEVFNYSLVYRSYFLSMSICQLRSFITSYSLSICFFICCICVLYYQPLSSSDQTYLLRALFSCCRRWKAVKYSSILDIYRVSSARCFYDLQDFISWLHLLSYYSSQSLTFLAASSRLLDRDSSCRIISTSASSSSTRPSRSAWLTILVSWELTSSMAPISTPCTCWLSPRTMAPYFCLSLQCKLQQRTSSNSRARSPLLRTRLRAAILTLLQHQRPRKSSMADMIASRPSQASPRLPKLSSSMSRSSWLKIPVFTRVSKLQLCPGCVNYLAVTRAQFSRCASLSSV